MIKTIHGGLRRIWAMQKRELPGRRRPSRIGRDRRKLGRTAVRRNRWIPDFKPQLTTASTDKDVRTGKCERILLSDAEADCPAGRLPIAIGPRGRHRPMSGRAEVAVW